MRCVRPSRQSVVVVGALRDVRVSLTRFTLARLRAEFEEGKRASFAKLHGPSRAMLSATLSLHPLQFRFAATKQPFLYRHDYVCTTHPPGGLWPFLNAAGASGSGQLPCCLLCMLLCPKRIRETSNMPLPLESGALGPRNPCMPWRGSRCGATGRAGRVPWPACTAG